MRKATKTLSKDDIARVTLVMLAYQKEHENVIGLVYRMKEANGETIDIANDLEVLEKSAEEVERLVNPELFSTESKGKAIRVVSE